MNRDLALGPPGDHASDPHGASARAARPGFARAALPDAHFHFFRADDLDKLSVHSLGEERVMLEARPDLFQIEGVDIVEIDHTVRIAHGDASDFIRLTVHRQRPVFDLAVGVDGNLSPFEDRLAHVDFDQLADDLWPNNAGEGFDFELALLRDAMIVNIFGEAANPVAAHLHLAAVGVVDLHLEVGDLRWMHRQQLVGADAEATVAELLSDRIQVVDVLFQAIEENKIIACAVHLGELQFHNALNS